MQLLERILTKLGHGLGLPDRYKLLKKIGAGAEGEVWLGVDDQTQSMVAVKLIPRGAPAWKLDMARREFSMLAQLGPGHLNIVRPLEVVLTSKKLVLITEYVPGGCLSDYLARHSCTEEVARYFFKQLLDALAFCHSRKIVYRDIKPANVLITGTQPPFLKLCDFGLADSWEGRPGPSFKSLVGTPGYMPPEITASFFTGAAELARRSRDAAALARRSKDAAAAAAAAAATAAATSMSCGGSGNMTSSKKQQQQQQRGEAAVAAAAAKGTLRPAGRGSSSGGGSGVGVDSSGSGRAGGGGISSKAKQVVGGMKRSASGALADMATAAARGAAAVPGGAGLSRSLAAVAAAVTGLQEGDAAAEAELSIVGDYDGQKADVYSLGVLLVVLVLRRMPWNYDYVAERLPLLKAMKALYDTAVVNRVSWRNATPKADTLSPQLAALLDGMLDPDPARRFSLQQVADSEWLALPVPHKLQCALEVLSEQQELREVRYLAALAAASEDGSCCPDAAAAAAVRQQLEAMIAAAQTVGKGYKLESRLVLSQIPQQQPQPSQRQPPQPPVEQQQPPVKQQQQQCVEDAGDSSSEEGCMAAIIPAAEQPPAAVAGAAGDAAALPGQPKDDPAAHAVDVTVQVV